MFYRPGATGVVPGCKKAPSMPSIRQQRIAAQIRTLLSELLLRDLRDPRLDSVTVTDVKVDRELQYADIYVAALGEDSRQEEIMAGMASASGYLRRELGNRLRLRSTPQLHFHWDPLPAQAEQISQILESLDIPPAEEEEEA